MKKILFCLFLFSTISLYSQTGDAETLKGDAAFKAKNYTEAIGWYEKAGELHNIKAMTKLADTYYTGLSTVPKDLTKSLYWNKQLTVWGKDNARFYKIGMMYQKGEGTPKDLCEASKWFSQGRVKNNSDCWLACREIGVQLYNLGMQAYKQNNFVESYKYFQSGTDVSDVNSIVALAELYYEGKGVKQSTYTAQTLYEDAASRGSEIAKVKLKTIENPTSGNGIMIKMKQSDGSYKEVSLESANGIGIYNKDGLSYEGEIQNGSFTGKGLLKMPSGVIYEGEFLNGEPHGKGKMYYSEGELQYDGAYVKGKMEGEGEYHYVGKEGAVYKGHMANGLFNGYGLLVSPTSTYEGGWLNDKKNGTGKTIFYNGDAYDGTYVNGVIQGEGTIIYAEGNKSKGSFVDGEPMGKWNFYNADGTIQERTYTSNGIYTTYTKTVSKIDYSKENKAYEEWWERNYGHNNTNFSNNSGNNSQSTFDQRRQAERAESQKRIEDRARQAERSTNYYNKKYGRD